MARTLRPFLANLVSSLRAVRDSALRLGDEAGCAVETRVRFAGRTLRMLTRHGSSDADEARRILRADSPCALAPDLQPRVIFDLEAGVGITAIYYATLYPDADIFCFETDPQQLELLQSNTQRHGARIEVFPIPWDDPDRAGGSAPLDVEAKAHRLIESLLAERGIERVDVARVDTDALGAAMVRALPAWLRAEVSVYSGRWRGSGRHAFRQCLSASHAMSLPNTPGAPLDYYQALRRPPAQAAQPVARMAG